MSTTKIYHNVTRLPLVSTAVMIWGTYEVHRVSRGTHPYWSPRLEAAGIQGFNKDRALEAGSVRDIAAKVATGDVVDLSDASITWTNLNGMPIPTLAALSTPSREQ
jgi:hypothetical protein